MEKKEKRAYEKYKTHITQQSQITKATPILVSLTTNGD